MEFLSGTTTSVESKLAKVAGLPIPLFATTPSQNITDVDQVTVLRLAHCQLSSPPDFLGLRLLTPHSAGAKCSPSSLFLFLDRFPNLTQLDLSCNEIPGTELARFLNTNTKIKHLE